MAKSSYGCHLQQIYFNIYQIHTKFRKHQSENKICQETNKLKNNYSLERAQFESLKNTLNINLYH